VLPHKARCYERTSALLQYAEGGFLQYAEGGFAGPRENWSEAASDGDRSIIEKFAGSIWANFAQFDCDLKTPR
jgi:hypothetical protein